MKKKKSKLAMLLDGEIKGTVKPIEKEKEKEKVKKKKNSNKRA